MDMGGECMNAPLCMERRRHERLRLLSEEAAVSMESGIGPIIEMSSSGFSAEYRNDGCLPGEECATNIFVRGGTMINNIPIKFEWVNGMGSNGHTNGAGATVGVQFQNLTVTQKLQIAALLKWHTEEE